MKYAFPLEMQNECVKNSHEQLLLSLIESHQHWNFIHVSTKKKKKKDIYNKTTKVTKSKWKMKQTKKTHTKKTASAEIRHVLQRCSVKENWELFMVEI